MPVLLGFVGNRKPGLVVVVDWTPGGNTNHIMYTKRNQFALIASRIMRKQHYHVASLLTFNLIYKKIKNQIDFNKIIQLLFNWPLWHFELHKTLLFLQELFLSHFPQQLHFKIPCPPHIECRLLISLRPEYLTNQQDHDRHLVLELEPCLQP
ncbi:hypothetical protein BpHYR1_037765 [Brachionus plicatilis]|uniref:Uncharacterized protein n=1 Tax=Brachionus plicatilis TaxID=10195 RepID=A0A3M7R9X9_BRAPC|nr:hypothetical protein BpHYR1_037765 [Brachionus plicatilis]